MPNKTIYVKEEDMPLLEKIQAENVDSISSKFAAFLRFEEGMKKPIPLTLVEPIPTLRDQFAMTAIIADAISSGIVAAAYIARGRAFTEEVGKKEDAAEQYYRTADAMLEARKSS